MIPERLRCPFCPREGLCGDRGLTTHLSRKRSCRLAYQHCLERLAREAEKRSYNKLGRRGGRSSLPQLYRHSPSIHGSSGSTSGSISDSDSDSQSSSDSDLLSSDSDSDSNFILDNSDLTRLEPVGDYADGERHGDEAGSSEETEGEEDILMDSSKADSSTGFYKVHPDAAWVYEKSPATPKYNLWEAIQAGRERVPPYYPWSSLAEFFLAKWLLSNKLSNEDIDEFLEMDLIAVSDSNIAASTEHYVNVLILSNTDFATLISECQNSQEADGRENAERTCRSVFNLIVTHTDYFGILRSNQTPYKIEENSLNGQIS